MFPGGAAISYASVFVTREGLGPGSAPSARPTFSHEGLFTLGWGFRRDFQFTARVPVRTTRREAFGLLPERGGTALGDMQLLLKWRFFRRDSERGTTQLALTLGPKLPTGRTDFRDSAGARLPVGLQGGTGSTDGYFALNATYTGLFNIRRLVADESFVYVARTEGSQQVRQGDFIESRFWLSYRPYQSKTLGGEWFIGPLLLWQRNHRDRLAAAQLVQSGGDAVALGLATYFSWRPGLHLFFEAAFPVWQTRRGQQTQLESRYSFGITRQFRFPVHF